MHLAEQVDWKRGRAVVFLDPYGAQTKWETLVALAETRAADIWILVPFGVAEARMLPHSGKSPMAGPIAARALSARTSGVTSRTKRSPAPLDQIYAVRTA